MPQQLQPGQPGHPLLGVSVSHLSTTFLHEVTAAGFPPSANIYKVEEAVIRRKGANILCPRDGRLGAAYVDCLSGPAIGDAVVMLSYAWGYSVGDIVDGLLEFCKNSQLDPTNIFVWICCLCNNQHRVKEAEEKREVVPFEEFRNVFQSRVLGIRHIVALMAPWSAPWYITRAWCILELFTALSVEGCTVTVTMPAKETAAMYSSLLKSGDGVHELYGALGGIRVKDAQAAIPEDKVKILRLIEDGRGCENLERHTIRFLQDWVVCTCEMHLREIKKSTPTNYATLAVALNEVGWLQYCIGHLRRAETLFLEAKRVREIANLLNTPEGALVLSNIGLVKTWTGETAEALQEYEKATQILVATGKDQSIAGAELLMTMGWAKERQGNPGMALLDYDAVKRIHTDIGCCHTTSVAWLQLRLGIAKKLNGDEKGSLEDLLRGKEFCIAEGFLLEPCFSSLLMELGKANKDEGKLADAMCNYTEAKRIRLATGLLESPDGAGLLACIGEVHELQGVVSTAVENYTESIRLYAEAGLLHIPEARLVAQRLSALDQARSRNCFCFCS